MKVVAFYCIISDASPCGTAEYNSEASASGRLQVLRLVPVGHST